MVKISNIFGDTYSGQAGKAGVFANWKGRPYRRKYVIPSNPNTTMQQNVRTSFENAVDKWHVFLSLQRAAYGYMSTGLVMSGFNLLVSRWQKMTAAQRAAYVAPYMGMKQIGSTDLTTITDIPTVLNQAEYTTAEKPLGLGQTTYTKGTSGVDPWAIVDINRGRVNIPENRTGALKISYTSLGRTIVKEALKTNPVAGDVLYTKYWPIDYKSVEIYDTDTIKDGIEVDITAGKFYMTNTLPGDTSGVIDSMKYTPLEVAKLETRKVDTNFITWRGYTNVNGILTNAQTSEDGNRDTRVELSGYQPIIKANVSALDAAKDEYVKLVTA